MSNQVVNATIRVRAIPLGALEQIMDLIAEEANRVSCDFTPTQEQLLVGVDKKPQLWSRDKPLSSVRGHGKMEK